MSAERPGRFESSLKLLSPLLAIAAFLWGVYTYRDTQRQQMAREAADARRSAETRRIEATRPFLDKQLALYIEATRVTATIATSADPKEIAAAKKRFRELYYGELGLVERQGVATAMVAFKDGLDTNKGQEELGFLALKLAHACRDELAASWGTDAWKIEPPDPSARGEK